VQDLSSHCSMSNGASAPPAANDIEPHDQMSPKGAPTKTEPPQPQEMAMLQPPATSQNGGSGQTGAMSPPVTSQTPAAPASPTDSNSQMGNSPANNTGMTAGEANRDAQAARQGELSTNPTTGNTTGRGVYDQGNNKPTPTNPNATPTSPNSTAPQANTNDVNKPLYERQATDIPWAKGSSGTSSNTTTSPNPQ
jgi:hypothetical protein